MDSQMVYQWTVPVFPVDAQTAGEELEKIVVKHGALRPDRVVEESRAPEAPLHSCFEWNDRRAAEKYRCRQAQDLIRNIVTVKIGLIEAPAPIRAFVNVRKDREYIPVAQVLLSPRLRQDMLDAAYRDMKAFHRKYAALDSLSELMLSIEQSIERYHQEVQR